MAGADQAVRNMLPAMSGAHLLREPWAQSYLMPIYGLTAQLPKHAS